MANATMLESFDDNLTPDERLLEHAVLDALGLLDTDDAALFDRSFHAAPESLRLRIIALQASIAADGAFGSSDSPPPALGAQVVDGVMDEVDRSVKELAPLAIIGRDVRTSTRRGLFMPATFWRAASLALAAGLVTSLFFFSRAIEYNEQLRQDREGSILERPFRDFPELRSPVLTADLHRSLQAVSDNFSGCTATVSLDYTRGTVAVFGFGLRGGTYKVQMLDGGKLLHEEALRASPLGISGALLTCASHHIALLPTATLRIVDGAGNVVLA